MVKIPRVIAFTIGLFLCLVLSGQSAENNKLIFQETFDNEFSVRRNGGTPYVTTFVNGVAVMNGSSSGIQTNKIFKGSGSIRAVFKSLNITSGDYIVDFRTNGGTGYLYFNSTTTVSGSGGGTMYVDGVQTNTVSNNTKEIIYTGISVDNNSGWIGRWNGGGGYLEAEFDLLELYNYTLSAEEVFNLYSNRRFQPASTHEEQLGYELGLDPGMSDLSEWTETSTATTKLVTEGLPPGYSSAIQINITAGGGITMANPPTMIVGQRYKHSLLYRVFNAAWRVRGYQGKITGDFSTDNLTNITGKWSWLHSYGVGSGGGGAEGLLLDRTGADSIQVAYWAFVPIYADKTSKIFELSAQSKVIEDKLGSSLTISNVTISKQGDANTMLFVDGTDPRIDCGDLGDFIGDQTVIWWMKPFSDGQSDAGRVMSNGEFDVRMGSSFRIYYTNDQTDWRYSPTNAWNYNTWIHYTITRQRDGTTMLYLNGELQASTGTDGEPDASLTNMYIGNNSGNGVDFDGLFGDVKIYEGILSAEEVSQSYTSEKHLYK